MDERKNVDCITGEDDSDIKIARPGKAAGKTDGAEVGAREFLLQRENGNIALARELGKTLAKGLLSYRLPQVLEWNQNMEAAILYSYALIQGVEEASPHSILSHTTTGAFYDFMEEKDTEFYEGINDSAIFSLYMRTQHEPERLLAVGQVFAKQCGMAEDEHYIRLGAQIYTDSRRACMDALAKVPYQKD